MLKEKSFDAPIPGMSLTHELGARPWQSPSKLSDIDEIVSYYTDRMSTDEFIDKAVDTMEMGIPLTDIANILQLGNVMEGIHNIDTGMLVLPIIIEMLKVIGDEAGIKYDDGLSKKAPINENKTRDTLVDKAARKLQIKLNEEKNGKAVKEEPKVVEEVEEEPTGLMSRRV
tara:strand:- start:6674 stop:7186 length:513 start_codon:yes stop_codon:yes gene_type:complete